MENTTDTAAAPEQGPMDEHAAVDWLLTPETKEPEAEADEAPQNETEAEETEADDVAPDEAENTDDDAEAEDAEADSDEDEDDAEEDTDSDDDEEQPADDQTFTVSVDGETREVTLDELKRGYSGQAYIQKGMEQAKQLQKQLQEQAQAVQQERQTIFQMYQQAQQTGFQPAPEPPKRELLENDPIAYMEAEAKYRDDLLAYQQQQQQVQYLQHREEQARQAQMHQHLESEMQRLMQVLPEFGDAKKAPELRDRLTKSAVKYFNYSPEEVNQVADHRAIKVLNDAIAYRELMDGKQAARKPQERAKAVTKPRGKSQQASKRMKAQKAMQRAMRTQSDEDWVNVLLDPNS